MYSDDCFRCETTVTHTLDFCLHTIFIYFIPEIFFTQLLNSYISIFLVDRFNFCILVMKLLRKCSQFMFLLRFWAYDWLQSLSRIKIRKLIHQQEKLTNIINLTCLLSSTNLFEWTFAVNIHLYALAHNAVHLAFAEFRSKLSLYNVLSRSLISNMWFKCIVKKSDWEIAADLLT